MERSRVCRGVVGAALVAALLSGCAGTEYTYVRDTDGATYFKVPSNWRQIDQKALDKAVFGDLESAAARVQKQDVWIVAFDAHAQPSLDHLLSAPPGPDDQPFVIAKVQKLSESERNQVSLNALRNSMSLPVALPDDVRQQFEESGAYQNFELLADQVLPVQEGVRGVRTIFNLRVNGGPLQTFDETAYLSADGTRISALLIRCSAACYRQRAAELGKIAESFKVKRILTQ